MITLINLNNRKEFKQFNKIVIDVFNIGCEVFKDFIILDNDVLRCKRENINGVYEVVFYPK